MNQVPQQILELVIAETAEPVVIVRVDQSEWPVVLRNRAFEALGNEDAMGQPFADVIEQMVGRELALEISEAVRSGQETSFPVEQGGREYLLSLKPLEVAGDEGASFCAALWRSGGAGASTDSEMQHALLKAKRQIRDLARDDPVTGLLNERAFREVLDHDWAVAGREKGTLAIVVFVLDDFDAYIDVFGRHASDSCLRRVGQAIRRCLRRASDVVARIGGQQLVVLSHASGEQGVTEFAGNISTAVRELGLHHPRSSVGRFVTVSCQTGVAYPGEESRSAAEFFDALLADAAG
jgi:diguanylate cyclase (GGDEF)-like protein